MRNLRASNFLTRVCRSSLVVLCVFAPPVATAESTVIIGGAGASYQSYSPRPTMAYRQRGTATSYPYSNSAQSLSRPSTLYFPLPEYPRSATTVQGFSSSAQAVVAEPNLTPPPHYELQQFNRMLASGLTGPPQSRVPLQPITVASEAAESTVIIGGAGASYQSYSPRPTMAYRQRGTATSYPYSNSAQSLSRPSTLYFPLPEYPRSATTVQGFSSSAQAVVAEPNLTPPPHYELQQFNRMLASGLTGPPQSRVPLQPITVASEAAKAELRAKTQDIREPRAQAPASKGIAVAVASLQATEEVAAPGFPRRQEPVSKEEAENFNPAAATMKAQGAPEEAGFGALKAETPGVGNPAIDDDTSLTLSLEPGSQKGTVPPPDASEEGIDTTVQATATGATESPDQETPPPMLGSMVTEQVGNSLQTDDLSLDLLDSPLRLEFSSGNADLTPQNTKILESLAAAMNADENLTVQLLAYAKGTGTEASNAARRLSLLRALAVRTFLLDQGVSSAGVLVRALGDEPVLGSPDRVDITALP